MQTIFYIFDVHEHFLVFLGLTNKFFSIIHTPSSVNRNYDDMTRIADFNQPKVNFRLPNHKPDNIWRSSKSLKQRMCNQPEYPTHMEIIEAPDAWQGCLAKITVQLMLVTYPHGWRRHSKMFLCRTFPWYNQWPIHVYRWRIYSQGSCKQQKFNKNRISQLFISDNVSKTVPIESAEVKKTTFQQFKSRPMFNLLLIPWSVPVQILYTLQKMGRRGWRRKVDFCCI